MLFKNGCKHDWVILSEETTKSALEVLKDCGKSINNYCLELTERKVIQVVTCKKCGKLKRYVTCI